MPTLKKKILFSFLIMVILTIAFSATAFAGTSISGSSNVYPGSTYTYTVTVSYSASTIWGTSSTSGVIGTQSKSWNKDSTSGTNQNLTATTTFKVTIPKDAAIGSTGTISVSGTGSSVDTSTSPVTVSSFNISGSKTITVVKRPSATATPKPTATPKLTTWEVVIEDIDNLEEGGSISVAMSPEEEDEINVPVEVFQAAKDKKAVVNVNYGSYVCTLDGSKIGTVPSSGSVNVGLNLRPAERPDDMLFFDLNNKGNLFYEATYAVQPFIELPDGLIYVYRQYNNTNIVEYVNGAKTDGAGNVLVRVYAPGTYIVSAASIDGTEGNMDAETFIELFATPTPAPTPEPTATPLPTPTPEPEKVSGGGSMAMVFLLAVMFVLVLAALFVVIISNRNK